MDDLLWSSGLSSPVDSGDSKTCSDTCVSVNEQLKTPISLGSCIPTFQFTSASPVPQGAVARVDSPQLSSVNNNSAPRQIRGRPVSSKTKRTCKTVGKGTTKRKLLQTELRFDCILTDPLGKKKCPFPRPSASTPFTMEPSGLIQANNTLNDSNYLFSLGAPTLDFSSTSKSKSPTLDSFASDPKCQPSNQEVMAFLKKM